MRRQSGNTKLELYPGRINAMREMKRSYGGSIGECRAFRSVGLSQPDLIRAEDFQIDTDGLAGGVGREQQKV